MHTLFRTAALAARSTALLGPVVLRPPLAFAACSALAAAVVAAIVLFLCVGEYTRRTRAVGVTVPVAGVTRLMPPQSAVVVERRVHEGQRVRAGDVLFVLSAERLVHHGGRVTGTQGAILEQLRQRLASVADDTSRIAELARTQAGAASRRLAALEQEAALLAGETATQSARVASAHEQVRRLEELLAQGFASEAAVQLRRDDLLDQGGRLQWLLRNRVAVQREAAAAASELRQIPLRAAQQRSELRRLASAVEQEIAAAEANRQIVVAAPHDGTITAILADQGHAVGALPLATLLPAGSPLEAHVFVPSRAVGFVEPGQAVRIRFAAFPHQKFGQYDGRVAQVSRTALAPAEIPPQLASLAQQGEGFYRISIRLASPHVTTYGRQQALVAGMQLEADVLQDRRRLIEWVFEPVFSLRGKV